MKKLTYLIMTTAMLGMTACNAGNKTGYTITGTVEGAADGDTVYLQESTGRSLVKLDTAIIAKGEFTFTGTQDSAVNRYITCDVNGETVLADLFLENGKIKVLISPENSSATGTANNDIYQGIKDQFTEIFKKANAIDQAMGDSTLSDEQKAEKMKENSQLEERYNEIVKEATQKNITNPIGIHLFKQNYYNNSTAENEALLEQIPANFQTDERIARIKELTEKQKATAVGTKFIDFEMKTPEGKAIKLSDYVGKGKIVLVDFWASWCGPCRREMPNIVAAYAKYKSKNFEIVGVSLDRDLDSWKEAIKQDKITWPQMSDLKFWQSEAAGLYAVNSIPHTILIDGEGTIIARGLHGESLLNKLAEVIK